MSFKAKQSSCVCSATVQIQNSNMVAFSILFTIVLSIFFLELFLYCILYFTRGGNILAPGYFMVWSSTISGLVLFLCLMNFTEYAWVHTSVVIVLQIFVVVMFSKSYIRPPQREYDCRNSRIKKHNLTLREVLSSLYERTPLEEQNLLEKGVNSGKQFTITEMMLTGGTAERFNAPISAVWLKKHPRSVHALTHDIDFLLVTELKKYHCNCIFDFIGTGSLLPGFAYIRHSATSESISAKLINEDFYLSRVLSSFTSPVSAIARVEGPANLRLGRFCTSTCGMFDGDATIAFQCPFWPDQVCDWKFRPNRMWPSREDVLRICSFGCHLVPKSQRNDDEGLTWRISFSEAEVALSLLVPRMARIAFIGLKVISMGFLSLTCERIKSYHLKCILFNTLEKTEPAFWLNDSNVEAGFHMLLNELKKSIQTASCPHYWIPHINLFQELEQNDVTYLSEVIEKVEKKPEKHFELLELLKIENEKDDIVIEEKDIFP